MTSLRSLGDLLAVVPYLLGFHPADSAVLFGVRAKKIIFQVRGDLPSPDDVPEVARYYAGLLVRQRAGSAIVLGYGAGPAVTPIVLALLAAIEARGVMVLDALRVADGRYWSYLCDEPMCCPLDGQPYDAVTHPLAVAAVTDGMVALPSRQALQRRFAPVTGAARQAMDEATRKANDRLAAHHFGVPDAGIGTAGAAAVDAAVLRHRGGGWLTDDEVAWLAAVLSHPPVRDYAWRSVGGDLRVHIALWSDVLRRADPGLAAAPGSLLAFAAWRAGEGAVASIALERALAAEPEYGMALVMARALAGALSPTDWEAALVGV
jgi:hypothetical protein